MKQQRTRRFMSDYCETMRAKLEAEARHTAPWLSQRAAAVWMHASLCSSDAGSLSHEPGLAYCIPETRAWGGRCLTGHVLQPFGTDGIMRRLWV